MTKKPTKKPTVQVEEVMAEKIDAKGKISKPSTKYHFSIKLTPEKLDDAVHEAETPQEEEEDGKAREDASAFEEKRREHHFAKEKEAVHEAETSKVKPLPIKEETPEAGDVQHIKYSEQDRPLTSGQAPVIPAKLEDIKQSITLLKANKKDYKELQDFVRPSFLVKAQAILKKTGTLKYWNNTLVGIMKGIDRFISFITKANHGKHDAVDKARSPILFGLWVFFIFFIIGGTWASLAPIDQATHAQGFIVTSSKKQVIQHREGGILQAIYVKEGDHVTANQPLVKLTEEQVTAKLRSLYSQKDGAEKRVKTTQEQVLAFRDLAKKGFVSQLRVHEQEESETRAKASLSEITSNIEALEESFERLTLKSPVNGVVTQINVNTIGSTVGQSQPIMTITPSDEDLILEAYVQAKDIEPVHVGLKAVVNISAFRAKTTSHLDGIVTYVSPDVVDYVQQQGRSTQENMLLQRGAFYKVRISIDKKQLKKISKVKDYELSPGMDADIQITVGERTLVQYLLDPILGSFWHAFKEK
jgi:multidrug efflux pump subunit AcrA (membrane-fusion protein)